MKNGAHRGYSPALGKADKVGDVYWGLRFRAVRKREQPPLPPLQQIQPGGAGVC